MRTFMNVLSGALAVMLVTAACSFDDSSAGDLDGDSSGGSFVDCTWSDGMRLFGEQVNPADDLKTSCKFA